MRMHPIWSGVIGFGLVNIPVRLYSPAPSEGIDLDYLHKKDRSPIRYARICKEEEKEIPYKDIERGFQYAPGSYVVVTEADFKRANVRRTQMIDILHFADEDEIDPVYYEKPYYLEPDEKSSRSYALLREALAASKKVGVATFVLRSRQHLAAVRAMGDVLVLEQLRFQSDVSPAGDLALPEVASSARELKLARELIDKRTERFRPEAHKDAYTAELKALIAAKVKGRPPKASGKAPQPTRVRDLMSALKKSLATEGARSGR